MVTVQLKASRELIEQMLVLGDRRIVGVAFAETGLDVEPTAQILFEIDAPDAPEGAVEMSPVLQRHADGTVVMLDPGWITG